MLNLVKLLNQLIELIPSGNIQVNMYIAPMILYTYKWGFIVICGKFVINFIIYQLTANDDRKPDEREMLLNIVQRDLSSIPYRFEVVNVNKSKGKQ